MSAVAFANNDIAILAWSCRRKLAGCLGFSIHRVDAETGVETPLPAWVGFQGEESEAWKPKTTDAWPVQKFNWRDLTARRGGVYQYKVVPMGGAPGALHPLPHARPWLTGPVHLTASCGAFSVYFNRGILASQSVARRLPTGPDGAPEAQALERRIKDPEDPLRKDLSGELLAALRCLLDRAEREGGACYCALYQLTDPELCRSLLGNPRVHLILSNTGLRDEENAAIRRDLHASKVDITDRMLGSSHIGHNKIVVYVDGAGRPTAVLTGSTNWTAHGLCAQTNNAVIIESARLAGAYLAYWKRLARDNQESLGVASALQSASLRSDNEVSRRITRKDGTSVVAWFAPNTRQKQKGPATPPDLAEVFEVIGQARQAILFLAFQPGSPSILDAIRQAQAQNPSLFVRGALTQAPARRGGSIDLYHLTGTTRDATILQPSAVNDQYGSWEKELLKCGHAVIHDKIVVVDPFSERPVVITGSHNLGYTASYANDENLLIIRGHRGVAAAYATHVLDVYDHFRWRHALEVRKDKAWSALDPSDRWQDKYFQEGSAWRRELAFWMDGAEPRR